MSELQEAQFKKVIDRLLDDNKVLRDLVDWQAAENKRLRKELKSLVDWEEPLHRILRLSDGDFSYLEADFAKARAALGEGK